MDSALKKLPKSQEIIARARAITASQRPDLEGTYDFVLDRGEGAYVWDLDGNKYTDYTAATGAIILGYNNPTVNEAVIKQLSEKSSILPTTLSEAHLNLAERLLKTFQGFERILFYRTGSCATTAAVRLARLHTKRNIVLTSGYHGWHDWHLNMFPFFALPDPHYTDFKYNLNYLEKLLQENKGDVSCVIITPDPNFFDAEYFRELRELCNKYKVILIFDEVLSGFRYHLGGLYSKVGIQPDMITISKGLANGFSISAVLGKKEIMMERDNTHLVGTFHNELTPMVAALATLSVIEEQDVIGHLKTVGTLLMDGLNYLFKKVGARATTHRNPSLFHIIFEDSDLDKLFYQEVHSRGILLHPFDPQMVNFSHTEKDIQESLSAIEDALMSLKERLPAKFTDQNPGTVSEATMNVCTFHEFGGTRDYKSPITEEHLGWHWRHKEALKNTNA